MKVRVYIIFPVLLVIISLFCCLDQLKAQIDQSAVIIKKNYNEYSFGPSLCHGPYTRSTLNENNLWIKTCDGGYIAEIPGHGQGTRRVGVIIDIYASSKDLKSIFLSVLVQDRPIQSLMSIERNGDILVANYPGRMIHQYISWISDNVIIKFSSFEAKLPSNILKDYLTKYPPTVKFQPTDLSDESLIKNFYLQSLEIMEQKDQKRIAARGDDKKSELEAMSIQCQLEAGTRCVLGKNQGKYSDCPITLEQDPKKRKKAIQELRKELLSANIKKEKISFMHLPYGTCPLNPESTSRIEKSIK